MKSTAYTRSQCTAHNLSVRMDDGAPGRQAKQYIVNKIDAYTSPGIFHLQNGKTRDKLQADVCCSCYGQRMGEIERKG